MRKTKVLERLLFSTSWEDPLPDLEVFRIERDRDVVLSITSGGDKVLSLLTASPRRIVAVDMNPTQNHLLELKVAGIRGLDHGSFLELLGVRPSRRILQHYRCIRAHLSPAAAEYWDRSPEMLSKGVLTQGRFERYFGLFRRFLRVIEGERRIRTFFTFDRLDEQRAFYREEWNSTPWKLFFKVFFSRTMLASLGLDREFFKYVDEQDFSTNFYRKAEHVFSDLLVKTNYFLAQILLGRYLDEEQVPLYLKAANFDLIRANLDRLEIRHSDAESLLTALPADSIDKFDFTNIFEWMDERTFERVLHAAVRAARPGAAMTYRNTLVPRSHPPSLDGVVVSDRELARTLHHQDRSFVYSDFIVERVTK